MSRPYAGLLGGLARVPGVRSALLADAAEGLVVGEHSMEGVDAPAVAALAAGLARRLASAAAAAGRGPPEVVHLEAERGSLFAVPAGPDLLLVLVSEPDANAGLLRLALRDARERVV